uniref:Uncharacterized protein n=1 Tax=Eutreptiella gymnastica TaxID=73025 RepID=A0A7S1ITE3_9EUGL
MASFFACYTRGKPLSNITLLNGSNLDELDELYGSMGIQRNVNRLPTAATSTSESPETFNMHTVHNELAEETLDMRTVHDELAELSGSMSLSSNLNHVLATTEELVELSGSKSLQGFVPQEHLQGTNASKKHKEHTEHENHEKFVELTEAKPKAQEAQEVKAEDFPTGISAWDQMNAVGIKTPSYAKCTFGANKIQCEHGDGSNWAPIEGEIHGKKINMLGMEGRWDHEAQAIFWKASDGTRKWLRINNPVDTTCEWKVGNGMGGHEELVGTVSSLKQCVGAVKERFPSANGVSVAAAVETGKTGACYAKIDMTNIPGTATAWRTCMFPVPNAGILNDVESGSG